MQFDFITNASSSAGLDELEKEALFKREAQKAADTEQSTNASRADANPANAREDPKLPFKDEVSDDDDADYWKICRDNGIYFLIFGADCSDTPLVREHLGNGALFELIQKKAARVQDGWDFYSTGYQLMLIGACAMTLGCKLPTFLRNYMAKNYRSVGFQNAAIEQLRKAPSDGPDGYKESEPYDFKEPKHDRDCDCG